LVQHNNEEKANFKKDFKKKKDQLLEEMEKMVTALLKKQSDERKALMISWIPKLDINTDTPESPTSPELPTLLTPSNTFFNFLKTNSPLTPSS